MFKIVGCPPRTTSHVSNLLKLYNINTVRMIEKNNSETVTRGSYYTYSRRNRDWDQPEIL